MEENPFIKKVSDKINDLGLTAPAILLLEAHKPLAFLGSQLLLIAQPTLDIFLPKTFTQNSINLLAAPSQLEQLIDTLEINSAKSLPLMSQPESLTTSLTAFPNPNQLQTKERKS
jgi:hypothetical protein